MADLPMLLRELYEQNALRYTMEQMLGPHLCTSSTGKA